MGSRAKRTKSPSKSRSRKSGSDVGEKISKLIKQGRRLVNRLINNPSQLVFAGAICVIIWAQISPLIFDDDVYDDYNDFAEQADSLSSNGAAGGSEMADPNLAGQPGGVAPGADGAQPAAVAAPPRPKRQPFIPEVVVSKKAGNMLGNKKYLEGTRISMFSRVGGPRKKVVEESCTLDEYEVATEGHDLMNDPLYIFFGKHTRVGRHFFTEFFNLLAKRNNFRFVDGEYKLATKRRYISHEKQVLEMLSKTNCSTPEMPLLFSDHHHWLNLTDHNLPQATFLTFIRNPVDEFISEYYYCRFGTNDRPRYRTQDCKSMSLKKLDMSPAQCQQEYSKFIKNCVEPHPIQLVDRLCGPDPKCSMGDVSLSSHNFQRVMTVELTKQRILQNYMFVGVMDHMKESLSILEKVLPRFFRGSNEVYDSMDIADFKNKTSANKRMSLEELDNDVRTQIEQAMRHEIDLYKFIERILFDKLDENEIESEKVATEFVSVKAPKIAV